MLRWECKWIYISLTAKMAGKNFRPKWQPLRVPPAHDRTSKEKIFPARFLHLCNSKMAGDPSRAAGLKPDYHYSYFFLSQFLVPLLCPVPLDTITGGAGLESHGMPFGLDGAEFYRRAAAAAAERFDRCRSASVEPIACLLICIRIVYRLSVEKQYRSIFSFDSFNPRPVAARRTLIAAIFSPW